MTERFAIIGAGVMGENHARTMSTNKETAALDAIIDVDIDRAKYLAEKYGTRDTIAADNISDALNKKDLTAAIIASPSRFHCEQAVDLMENEVNVLIEKPVSPTEDQLTKIIEVANRKEKIAMAGHVELFNPTVEALKKLVGKRAISSIQLERLSQVKDSTRLYDNVVRDLMVHDISIAMNLVEGAYDDNPLKVVAAQGRKDTLAAPDPAQAILCFESGTDVYIRDSRRYVGGKKRSILIEAEDGVFKADLLSKSIEATRSTIGEFTPEGVYIEDTNTNKYYPSGSKQPLELEQEYFIKAIKGETSVADKQVSMEHALKILKLTNKILEIIESN